LFAGSTHGAALAPPVKLTGGGADLTIDRRSSTPSSPHDVPAREAALMAASQRPIAQAALTEAAGEPAWKELSN
jgi:hypothetical protein